MFVWPSVACGVQVLSEAEITTCVSARTLSSVPVAVGSAARTSVVPCLLSISNLRSARRAV